MNLRELREMDVLVKKKTRENSSERDKEEKLNKSVLYEEAKIRHYKKQNTAGRYGFVFHHINWRRGGFALSLIMIFTVLFNVISFCFQGPQPYVAGKRTLDVSNGKERNASDFVKTLILYGTRINNFDNFIDPEVPVEKKENMNLIFKQLGQTKFDVSCSLARADENGCVDFDIEYQSGNMSGVVALRLDKQNKFKIINMGKWE